MWNASVSLSMTRSKSILSIHAFLTSRPRSIAATTCPFTLHAGTSVSRVGGTERTMNAHKLFVALLGSLKESSCDLGPFPSSAGQRRASLGVSASFLATNGGTR